MGNNKNNPAYTRYVLVMIFLVAVFNTCDRTIMSVLVEDIRADLALSDRQMGFILGFVFALVHFLAGIPLARIADKWSRPKMIALALGGWSAMTAIGGMAQNFMQLAVARMGVGIGEAGGSPPSHALIAEYVKPERRSAAMAVLTLGAIAGLGLGVIYGGWASEHYGWRFALISVGLPGIALAILFWMTVADKRTAPGKSSSEEPLLSVLSVLFKNKPFVLLVLAACAINTTSMGLAMWTPTFLRRVYEFNAAEAGTWYFVLNTLPTAIGALGGAMVVDRMARRDFRWYGWLPGISAMLMVPLGIAFYLWPTEQTLFGVMPAGFMFSIIQSLLAATWAPVTMSLAQSLAPDSHRATAAASWSMISNFIGLGLGPLLVGDLTTRLTPSLGVDAVSWSLVIMTSTGLVASFFYFRLAASLKNH